MRSATKARTLFLDLFIGCKGSPRSRERPRAKIPILTFYSEVETLCSCDILLCLRTCSYEMMIYPADQVTGFRYALEERVGPSMPDPLLIYHPACQVCKETFCDLR